MRGIAEDASMMAQVKVAATAFPTSGSLPVIRPRSSFGRLSPLPASKTSLSSP